MQQTYIKNKGIAKTMIHTNDKNLVSELNWDADYDGDKANISIDVNENNGKRVKHYDIELDNDNLAELLNIPSINSPLEKRLLQDFKKSNKKQFKPMIIEFNDENEPFLKPNYDSPIENEQIIILNKIPKTLKLKLKKHKSNKHRRHHRKTTTYKLIKRPKTYKHHRTHSSTKTI
jgi:Fe2+ transport system protein B